MPSRRRRSQPTSNGGYFRVLAATVLLLLVARQLSSAADLTQRHLSEAFVSEKLDLPWKQAKSIVHGLYNALSTKGSFLNHVNQLREGVAKSDAEQQQKILRFDKYFHSYLYRPPVSRQQTSWKPAEECGQGPSYKKFFQQKKDRRSRYDEDQVIYNNFFSSNPDLLTNGGGTYVELGAFDGTTESNSRFFDMCLGWKGLLIEGNPESFQKVGQHRPNAHKMSFAPSCSLEYEMRNQTVSFAKYPMTNSGLRGLAKTYDAKPQVQVPCGPLGPVLEDIFDDNNKRINFMSLDVEGAEPLVLQTIDFSKVNIDVLMVEVANTFCSATSDCQSRNETRTIMARAGYKRHEALVPASDVYVHPDIEFPSKN